MRPSKSSTEPRRWRRIFPAIVPFTYQVAARNKLNAAIRLASGIDCQRKRRRTCVWCLRPVCHVPAAVDEQQGGGEHAEASIVEATSKYKTHERAKWAATNTILSDVLVPGKHGVGFERLLVQQLIVIERHGRLREQLAADAGGAQLINIAGQRRVIDARQHGVHDAKLLELAVKTAAHVAKVFSWHVNLAPHELPAQLVRGSASVGYMLLGIVTALATELRSVDKRVAFIGRCRRCSTSTHM